MRKRSVTPAVRRRRIFTDALLLLAGLALLLLMLDVPVPYFTEGQALSATQTRYLYGPGAVLARSEHEGNAVYILQDGSCYALCRLPRPRGLFHSGGSLSAAVNDPALPMLPVLLQDHLLVVVNNPDIAQVELVYYVYGGGVDSGFHVLRGDEPLVENCWLFYCPVRSSTLTIQSDGFLLRGYSGTGALLYETAVPDQWTQRWELTIPE